MKKTMPTAKIMRVQGHVLALLCYFDVGNSVLMQRRTHQLESCAAVALKVGSYQE